METTHEVNILVAHNPGGEVRFIAWLDDYRGKNLDSVRVTLDSSEVQSTFGRLHLGWAGRQETKHLVGKLERTGLNMYMGLGLIHSFLMQCPPHTDIRISRMMLAALNYLYARAGEAPPFVVCDTGTPQHEYTAYRLVDFSPEFKALQSQHA